MDRREFLTGIAAAAVATQIPAITAVAAQASSREYWVAFWARTPETGWMFYHGLVPTTKKVVWRLDSENYFGTAGEGEEVNAFDLMDADPKDVEVCFARVTSVVPNEDQLIAIIQLEAGLGGFG